MHWADVTERGGVVGMRLLFATYRLFGRRAFTLLLYPVAAYFCVMARGAREASTYYLDRVRERLRALARPVPVPLTTFRHVLEFGHAVLDKGAMWPIAFALKELTDAEEARISSLVKKAVSRGSISPPRNHCERKERDEQP